MTRDSWRLAKLMFLTVLLVAGGAGAVHLATVLLERTDGMTRYVRVDVWALQQAGYELQEVRAQFSRHVAGDAGVTIESIHKQLTRARTAMRLLRQGPHYEEFRLLVDIDGPARIAKAALSEIDRILGDRRDFRNDLEMLRRIDGLLAPPNATLAQLAIDLLEVRRELQDKDLDNVRWLTSINLWMLLGFATIVVIFVVFLIGETRAARRAERSATANERRTRHIAEHDMLTDLPNRVVFRRQLGETLAHARKSMSGVALYILNLDGFKDINDTFGQAFGDRLLIAAAQRLGTAIRGDDLLFRLGSDEFAVLQRSPARAANWHATAEILSAACARPFRLNGRKVHIGAGIGVARFPDDADMGEALLKCANMALTAAKTERGRFVAFEPAMMAQLESRKQLEEDLRQALANDELKVFFQAQVSFADQRCIGAEALIRWRHPKHGWLDPSSFIPIAEESGLILPLGRHVLEQACRAALSWRTLPESVVAVNVSPSQFIHQDIVEEVRSVLATTGLPAWRLELEITESILMRDERAAIATLNQLHELGIQLAIDDFGTGYSSLNYLKRFKVDKLKIDQSFVRDLAQDADDRRIVRAIVDLGSGLGMRTIAEGVENDEQLDILIGLGCDEGQGYYFAEPKPADDFRDWVEKWRFDPRPAGSEDLAASR